MPGHNGIISFLMSLDKADRFSKDVKLPSGQVGQVTILDQLAHYLDVSGSVIRGQNAKIASHRQKAFADLYGFSDDPDCMDALRRENEDAFREAFTKLRSRLKEATRTTQSATPRVVGALLEEDKDNPREQSPPSPFASLSLWMDQESSEPGVIYLRPDLVCHKLEMSDGITVTVKRVILAFNLGLGETVRASERQGADSRQPLVQSGAAFSVHGTGPARPRWLVVATDGEDIGSVLNLPNDFIKVKGVAPGDIIRAYLGGDRPRIEIALTFAFKTERPLTHLEKKVAALLKRYEIWPDERWQQIAAGMIAVRARTRHSGSPCTANQR